MLAMTTETELKFRIPPERLAAVRRAVATATACNEPLAALYFDTPDGRLAAARVALRLRREGPTWVQTLKAEGDGLMQRLEHNRVLGDSTEAPALDPIRHEGHPAADRLRRALGSAGASALVQTYATHVQRTRRTVRSGGAHIELALDEGHIEAGSRRLQLCELEFELLQGPPQALLDLAARWVQRFGLVLDMRSKSERGQLLAEGRDAAAPVQAEAPRLAPGVSPATAVAAMLGACLRPVLRQASVMADAGLADAALANAALAEAAPADPEALHQLRVALRALRSVLTVFGPVLPPPARVAAAALAPALAAQFGPLGAQRDQDVMAATLWPALRAAGAPLVEAPAEATETPNAADRAGMLALLTSAATQQLWLALLAACQPPPAAAPGAARPRLRPALRQPLDRLLHQVRRDAAAFDDLDEPRRHRLRRRIKRLRYATELSASLWPAKSLAAFVRRLRQAQAALGDYNDAGVALAGYRGLAEADARAWFAVGWLTARRETLAAPCVQVLKRLARQPAPWRKR